jgi:hypothetical protein
MAPQYQTTAIDGEFPELLLDLCSSLGMEMPTKGTDCTLFLLVDRRFEVQVRVFPVNYLLLACEFELPAQELSARLLEFNVFDEDPYPVVISMTQAGSLLLWRRVPASLVKERSAKVILDEFVAVLMEIRAPEASW